MYKAQELFSAREAIVGLSEMQYELEMRLLEIAVHCFHFLDCTMSN